MLVEHTFVTTLELDETFTAARGFLENLGFEITPGDQEPSSLEMRRGRFKGGNWGRVSESAQFVRLDFDRGRVTVAASVHERRKANRAYTALLSALTRALERVLVEFAPTSEARAEWDEADREVEHRAARRRRWINFGVGCLIVFVVFVVVLIVAMALAGK